jgi:hypothetical protein
MRRLWICLTVWALLTALPAAGQETVLGFLEPPKVDGCTPFTSNCERKPGVLRVHGWAVADSGINRVILQVDGVDVLQARHGALRGQIPDQHPGFPDSFRAGFSAFLNASDHLNGLHRITARVETNAGTSVQLLAVQENGTILFDGVQQVFWSYNTSILHPFGTINFPERNAELYGTCCNRFGGSCCPTTSFGTCCTEEPDPDDPNCCFRDKAGACCDPATNSACPTPIRYSPVEGWALDLGIETGDTGVGWVELLVDGSIVGNSRLTCHFNPATGGLTDCYGLQRLDVETNYPFALDAPNSGFRFALDVGRMIVDQGYVQGHHVLTARVGDISNQNHNVHEIPVNFLCLENLANESSFGEIEVPRRGRQQSGIMRFQGWALDGEGIDRVEVYVDGALVGDAFFGVTQGTRPLVQAMYPGFPDSAAPVWRLSAVDSNMFIDGQHQAQIIVTDLTGDETLIGEVTFSVNNGPF